ncbi:MAG: VOC family protein [Asticcacaulis sp.]
MSNLQYWHHHGGVSVPDLDEAIKWYSEKLGFSVEARFDIPPIPAEVAMLVNGDLRIELFEVPGAAPLPPERRQPNTDVKTHGNKHMSFAVACVEPFAEELEKRGVDIVWVRRFEFGANIFIRDIAGNLIEFVESPALTGKPSSL